MDNDFPSRESIPVTTADGCKLELRRHGEAKGNPVLLVHGASAASDTFRTAETKSVVRDLVGQKLDVWTLDWRASWRCVEDVYFNVAKGEPVSELFTVDAAAEHDVPAAIRAMRDHRVTGQIGLLGHCLGGGVVAQGIARGHIHPEDVTNVVLVALALFYRPALDTLLKAEDRPLEELLATRQGLLHPLIRGPSMKGEGIWDPLLEGPYQIWCKTPIRDDCQFEICHRLSYLFGMPYAPKKIPEVHKHLDSQFGWIATQFLLHCAQNLRRGHAAPFNAPMDDRQYLQPARFRDFNLTLITGDLNCLWHRDSIDTMYEWLRRGRTQDQPRSLHKHVLPRYAHQDLLWGKEAPADVFGYIRQGLGIIDIKSCAAAAPSGAEEAHLL